ncbi:MAG: TatD family hydrolase [Tannerella sp.]|jgi:TatD DNase family protein|nr:TatD family hydrolase [Tannerella sp.]
MIYCDIHSHQPPVHPEDIAIISVDLRNPHLPSGFLSGDRQSPSSPALNSFAVGIHPWQPDPHLMDKVREYAVMPSVAAIGETGLDKMTAKDENTFRLQQELFAAHTRLAEEVGKPLIIHCVRAWDELLHVRKTLKPSMPWIIHGFRGNEILAGQLINAGLYLSFGTNYRPNALKAAWEKKRLLAETDDENIDIRDIYKLISKELNIPEEHLSEAIETFFNLIIQ